MKLNFNLENNTRALSDSIDLKYIKKYFGGEREIRTLGTCFHVRSFSKRLV